MFNEKINVVMELYNNVNKIQTYIKILEKLPVENDGEI